MPRFARTFYEEVQSDAARGASADKKHRDIKPKKVVSRCSIVSYFGHAVSTPGVDRKPLAFASGSMSVISSTHLKSVEPTTTVTPLVKKCNSIACIAEPIRIASPMLRKLPGDSQVVDLTLMTPTPVKQTPLKHTTQEIACTTNSLPLQVRYEENTLVSGASENGLNAKNTNIINESQRNESATRTTPDAFCIPMSSPLRQHTSTQSSTPGPQLKPIQTPLSRDQLDRVQKIAN